MLLMADREGIPAKSGAPVRLAALLQQKREVLIERWMQRVLDDPEVPTANKLPRPALEDNIPVVLNRILERLMHRSSHQDAEELGRRLGDSGELGFAHARQRFASHYTVREALRELSLFRAAVLDICEESFDAIPIKEARLLHAAIDELMTVAADEFGSSELRAVEQVTAIVAHDLRNPVNIVSGHAQLLVDGVAIDSATVGASLARSAKLMSRLIEDLLVMSKLQLGQLSIEHARVDVRSAVNNVHEQLRHSAERKQIAMTCAMPEHEVVLACDPERIEQALGNLVSNAIKFTPVGGWIRIELELAPTRVVFRVTDSGPGVATEQYAQIFRPFWQGPNAARTGVGLGLAITRGIVEAHGGTIHVDKGSGGGAMFWFMLPLGPSERLSQSFGLEALNDEEP